MRKPPKSIAKRPDGETAIDEFWRADNWRDAAEAIYRAYGTKLWYFARSWLGDDDAWDVLHEAFVSIIQHLPTFQRRAQFQTWAHRIVHNCIRDWVRRRKASPIVASGDEPDVIQRLRTTTARYLKSGPRQQFEQLRKQLKPEDQALIVLRIERFTWKQIVEILSTEEAPEEDGAVRKRYSRLALQLRKAAREAGFVTDE